jgi:SAM-dependent methyltransferase
MSLLLNERFPRSNRYHPDWVIARASGGANALWLTEWLCELLDLTPGMRVLDLGCGRAMSSIFLHRELGVEVWATDLWFSVADNLQCVQDAGVSQGLHPIHADARALPFAAAFFDAVVSIDSFPYYGLDGTYVHYLCATAQARRRACNRGRRCDSGVRRGAGGARGWWEPMMTCIRTHGGSGTGNAAASSRSPTPSRCRALGNCGGMAARRLARQSRGIEALEGSRRKPHHVRTIARRLDVVIDRPVTSIPPGYGVFRCAGGPCERALPQFPAAATAAARRGRVLLV